MTFHIDNSTAYALASGLQQVIIENPDKNVRISDLTLVRLIAHFSNMAGFIQSPNEFVSTFQTMFGRRVISLPHSRHVVLWTACRYCGTQDEFPIEGLYGNYYCPKCSGPITERDCVDAERLVTRSDQAGS